MSDVPRPEDTVTKLRQWQHDLDMMFGSAHVVSAQGQLLLDAANSLEALSTPPASHREALASYAHEAWTGWMRYLFSRTTPAQGGMLIPAAWVERWQRQMDTRTNGSQLGTRRATGQRPIGCSRLWNRWA